jgi:membrane-associated phospholipid phosphatase
MVGTRRLVIVLLTAVLAPGLQARAEEEKKPFVPPDAPLTWHQVGKDAEYVFGRPAHLDKRGWARVAWAVGVGASLYLVRDEVRNWVADHADQFPSSLLKEDRKMGSAATPVVTSLGFWIAGQARDSARDKETATLLLENLGYASVVTGAMQLVVVTERPREGNDISYFGTGGHSASGDVTVAASMLAPIIDRHLLVEAEDGRGVRFWKRFGQVGLYSAAGLVAVQRVWSEAHYLPDVYFGYLNGLAVGKLLVDSRKGGREWRDERRKSRVQVSTTANGLLISWP